MIAQDVSSAIVQRGPPGHDDRVFPSVHNPWGGRARGHWGGGVHTFYMNITDDKFVLSF